MKKRIKLKLVKQRNRLKFFKNYEEFINSRHYKKCGNGCTKEFFINLSNTMIDYKKRKQYGLTRNWNKINISYDFINFLATSRCWNCTDCEDCWECVDCSYCVTCDKCKSLYGVVRSAEYKSEL